MVDLMVKARCAARETPFANPHCTILRLMDFTSLRARDGLYTSVSAQITGKRGRPVQGRGSLHVNDFHTDAPLA